MLNYQRVTNVRVKFQGYAQPLASQIHPRPQWVEQASYSYWFRGSKHFPDTLGILWHKLNTLYGLYNIYIYYDYILYVVIAYGKVYIPYSLNVLQNVYGHGNKTMYYSVYKCIYNLLSILYY
jgi:hypothetical protein